MLPQFGLAHTLMAIQGQIQKALKAIFQKDIFLHGSGRTDKKQIAHRDLINTSLIDKITSKTLHLVKALNSKLSKDILIKKTYIVPDHFHARKSVMNQKIYVYRIFNGPHSDPFLNNNAHWISRLLD